MDDPYLDELKKKFRDYSIELKKLKQKLLKSSPPEQSKIIKKMDIIATKMKNNQKQAAKVTKSRLKDKRKNYKKRT